MASSGSSGGRGSSEEHEPSAKKAKPNGFDSDEDKKIYYSGESELDPEVEEALRKYYEQVEASEGFDIDDDPPDCGQLGLIIPFLKPDEDFSESEVLEEVNNGSILAMEEFNVKNATNYKFVKVLKGNSLVVGGYIFYITFEANDDDKGETEIFQAKVYFGIGVEPEPMMCRRKPK